MNVDVLVGAAAAIVGGIIGGWIQGKAWYHYERRRVADVEAEQAKTVRTLISLEVDHNLRILRDFWNSVNDVDNKERDAREAGFRLAGRLIELPAPTWSHKVWESQLGQLVQALGPELIRQVHDFHASLDRITSMREGLIALREDERQEMMSPDRVILPALKFQRRAPLVMEQWQRLVQNILDTGNPLGPKKQ
jgi:hypothetical protein